MENKNFIIKNISQVNLSNDININSSAIYSSPYNNMILFLFNNNLLYKGKYIEQQNSNNFIFEKIEPNMNKSNTNLQQKFLACDFTSNYIYFITKNKNIILYSNYLSNDFNKKEIISILPGIIQKKKIKSISCGINSSLFLTYGGMVYSNFDKNKENQKLITDLLEYNIDQIYSGAQHCFCVGQKRNISEGGSMVFSWGNNSFSQCGFDSQINNIENPKMIFKNIFIKDISLGYNHSMILTDNGEVLIFGDNKNNQCSTENKNIIKLIENDDIIPITEINYYVSAIDYLVKNNEKIVKIEAKKDSSMIITDKKSIIFRGKIFDGKEKIFKLMNNSKNLNINTNFLYCFGGDNFFLILNNNTDNHNIYTEIKNSNNTNMINNYKKVKIYNNSDNKTPKKLLNNENEEETILSNNTKSFQQRSITPINNKYKTISFNNDLTFEELKKEQNKALMANSDISEDTLTELRSYISLLGISFSSTYNDSNLSFRPTNLPPKSKEEEDFHKQLVLQNRQMYINVLKQKQEMEKINMYNLEQKHKQEKIKAEFWANKIIPNWTKMKNNKNLKKYFYEGIPNVIRGKIWSLCIGNKFSITREYYDIEAKKSIQLLMKLEKNSLKKNQTEESELSSSISLTTKKIYSKYIKQTLDKEKSINLIDLDIERTFPYMGVFKQDSPLGENLREILRIFVVARPDIGYVQGLSYIAATLLLQMDKFQAFVCFMNIILSPNILPFYLLDEKNIKKRLDLFNDIFKINLPELFEHFKENEIMPEHYLLEWIMTLYTRNVFIDLSFRIWDIYMIEGIICLYKTAVVIFSIHQKDYLHMEFSDILNHLKNLETNKYNEDKFIEAMNKVKFNDKIMNQIYQLNEEYLLYE
jgi:alpha-tubulin suppressor-like RCC1 family protein